MEKIIKITFLLLFLTVTVENKSNSIQCQDENGNAVDWFVIYKLPKVRESSNAMIRKGVAYLYITSETIDNGWKLSKKDISHLDSIPGNTLDVLYNDDIAEESAWIMYNDQSPDSASSYSKYGHAKGVIISNENQGFWLIHSVPSFPPSPRTGIGKKRTTIQLESEETDASNNDEKKIVLPIGEYTYPSSGRTNGQSFLCISVKASQMMTVVTQLIYNQIITYKYNVPNDLKEQFSYFLNATRRPRLYPPYKKKNQFQSINGQEFISFAKSDRWQKELYDDFVAPQLECNMLAETWLNGRGKLPSECTGTQVLNVQSIVLHTANVDFKSSKDHSKWAVAETNKKNKSWICIGDINRADTQFNRGGGTVCINSPKLWKNYRSSVNEIEPCPRKEEKKTGFFQSIKKWFWNIVH